jgi:hypothetical protein
MYRLRQSRILDREVLNSTMWCFWISTVTMAKHWVGVTLLFAMLILSLNASLNSLRMLVVVVMSLAAGRRKITISST